MKVTEKVQKLAKGDYEFSKLSQQGRVVAEYIWIGGSGLDIRAKARTLNLPQITSLSQIPEWNYDGSSTNQAEGHDSEVLLIPRAFYPDPFRLQNNVLVLCEAVRASGGPANSSFREEARLIFEQCKGEAPWFGMEQEYMLLRADTYPHWPLGFPEGGYPEEQGPYYCSLGAQNTFGRQVMEAHLKCCLYAGLTISGTNAEVMPGQWEYQIGPVEGLQAADEMWVSRYLLTRVAEHYGVAVSFECKPFKNWNGAGFHTNFSTNGTRAENGMEVINTMVGRLGEKHKELIEVSGKGNDNRLTGKHETSSIKRFSSGIANRGASIRIPRTTEKDGKGYFEDRRPASNCDPYVVTSMIADIAINSGTNIARIHDRYVEFAQGLNH